MQQRSEGRTCNFYIPGQSQWIFASNFSRYLGTFPYSLASDGCQVTALIFSRKEWETIKKKVYSIQLNKHILSTFYVQGRARDRELSKCNFCSQLIV